LTDYSIEPLTSVDDLLISTGSVVLLMTVLSKSTTSLLLTTKPFEGLAISGLHPSRILPEIKPADPVFNETQTLVEAVVTALFVILQLLIVKSVACKNKQLALIVDVQSRYETET